MKNKVVVILGPTASGKSKLGVQLARCCNGEIISGDSMLVYRRMNIGTDKPSIEDMQGVPHYLIDILEPQEHFNVYQFQQYASQLITEINSRGKIPIVVGGTGLYIQALLENYNFHDTVCESYCCEKYDSYVFGLTMDRQVLYEKINRRVNAMLSMGLEGEVRSLLAEGVSPDCQSMKSIGYRQMLWYINHGMDYNEMVSKIKQATRNYAKRQFTWYRRMNYIHWVYVDMFSCEKKIAEELCSRLVINWNLR